jgi:hypothetical protein
MSAFERSELEGYEALVSELRATAPVAPERLRERVLEGGPAARAPRSRKRRLVLVVAPAAVVLAVGAALVHGFVNTGSQPRAFLEANLNQGSAATPQSKVVHGNVARSTPQAATADKRVLSPQSKVTHWSSAYAPSTTSEQVLSGKASQSLDSLGAARGRVTIPRDRLVHAVASLDVGVRRSKLSQATNAASRIVGSYGGYAQSVRYQSTRQGYGEAVLALRVPVQNAEAAIAKLGGLGKLLSQQVSTQDLQARLTHENSGIGSLRRAIDVYEKALQDTTLPASQRVTIQIRLNNARHALAQLRHARNGTLASGATASISLLLTTRNHAIVVPHHHKSGRFGRLLGSAAGFLGLEGIIVIYALIVISPFVLLAALAWWIVRERRRREERLLASA